MPQFKVIVRTTIPAGTLRKLGEIIELSDADAEAFLKSKAIEPIKTTTPKKKD